ncbi:MAG: polymerase sigma-70 factor, subfamily [Frankiaceae bacterium]|jgi:RNA polymerase sigma-70 factor (ECF subfamily)|nr:polymerase sigma-70 factor, subfamily [Frankiaceae bacterium]
MSDEPSLAVSAREAEFRSFYGDHYRAVAGYCWTLVRDDETAHELAQEAFTRLYGRWIGVRSPRAYVFRVATNLAKVAWRERRDTREAVRTLASHREVHDRSSEDDSARFAVRDAVGALPARYRDVVLLYYYADLPVSDVAAAVGRPAGSVKRMLNEARTRLARSLGDTHA